LQRIFDFGTGENESMSLTTSTGVISGQLRFSMKNGDLEEQLNAPHLALYTWTHVAVTLEASGASMYVNGELVTESDNFTINPLDFKPVLNYIGRSQNDSDPLFYGYIDDFRIYNYALQANEITQLNADTTTYEPVTNSYNGLSIWPVPADNVLNVNFSLTKKTEFHAIEMLNMDGRTLIHKDIKSIASSQLNVSNIPAGIYLLKLSSQKNSILKKIVIKH
ncbi:MAG TPA: LamG-like jellyroll fold domain-containing protein, partial [Bacteroidales bacterium]|nr:LamG-like jellyroll fold domain-containing protein [Bacteroidales bacterium]